MYSVDWEARSRPYARQVAFARLIEVAARAPMVETMRHLPSCSFIAGAMHAAMVASSAYGNDAEGLFRCCYLWASREEDES
jgi:hypothetical protein